MAESLVVRFHGAEIGRVERGGRLERIRLFIGPDGGPADVRLTEAFATLPEAEVRTDLASNLFGGYAPEGNQRRALAERHSFDPRDLYATLEQFGSSIAGAVTFHSEADPPVSPPSYESLSASDLGRLLRRAVKDGDLAVRDDSRSMIQGFQPKVLLTRFAEDGPWLQPHGGSHSTHIVKPQLPSRPSAIHDEHYSHQLARELGLASFRSSIGRAGAATYLAIERFDRRVSGEAVELVHQEDLAQALSLDWVDDQAKFQDPRDPASARRPSAMRPPEAAASLDEDAVELWIRQLTFRILIGDNDGHAKNVGIIHLPGRDTLSDIYDAVPNLYQPGRIDWNLALAVDGEFDHRRMSVERIVREADSWRVTSRRRIDAVVQDAIERFARTLDATEVPRETTPGMRAGLEWNVTRLLAGQEIGQPRGM
ncbi:type II toxin-antitoxin system HipA family toxin [Clavibacter sepedonicus]|uniref:type II toxin-antitoxin system HipA family toxin n=1 Tax=Clavibacter sepedonicus TaxID=31964 RepID=UPI003DA5633D